MSTVQFWTINGWRPHVSGYAIMCHHIAPNLGGACESIAAIFFMGGPYTVYGIPSTHLRH